MKLYILLIVLLNTTWINAAAAAATEPATTKAPLKISKDEALETEAAYKALSYEDKSKRCTGLYNQKECNKIKHCCYWEYKDPKYNEFQPVCYNFEVLEKFYVRDSDAYIMKLNQSSRRNNVNEGNLCDLLPFDNTFPEVRACSCNHMADLSGTIMRFYSMAIMLMFVIIMITGS